jgi:hypothetical protein
VTLWEKQVMFTRMIADLIRFAGNQDILVALREVMRTDEQQRIYLATGRSKTRNSRHLVCLAADLVIYEHDGTVISDSNDSRYKLLGLRWEEMGGRWGGRFGDDPTTEKIEGWDAGHFEIVP